MMPFYNGCREEMMLYYLYMMSDGGISYNEQNMFNDICKEMRVDEGIKHSVIAECKEIAKHSENTLDIIKSENIDEIVRSGIFGLKNASSLATIIWNLVNLGYADTYYSDEEKKIVRYFLKKWNINSEVYQEMVDTADTMLALSKQKDWITSTLPKDNIRNEKEKRIDSEINTLLSDIKLTIKELTM